MVKTKVTVTEENGNWRVQGTTYIDNDENRPWPVCFDCSTREEAIEWVSKHGWELQEQDD